MSSGRGKQLEKELGEVAAFGAFQLFPSARRLEREGKAVEIGGRALHVLIELVKQAGRVVTKAELLSAIWADTTVVEGVLRTHVHSLRKVLGDGVEGARYVTSVAGRGYCFVAPVIRSAAVAATPAAPNAWKPPPGLPPRLARMAGRDEAVRALAAQLAEHRFVTVLGAAGIGKTTVAVAVGHALFGDFGGAVRFIELGSLTDPALLAATVASSLGLPMQTDDVLESLRAFLQDKRILLVLDNCEHVVQAAASLAEHLFLRTPHVHLLTTSREALRVEGERAYRLGPLETPTETLRMDADNVLTFPAVQVFLERAAANGWSGELMDGDAPIVAETCRRLDGVPFALELSASFVGQYGLQGVAALLDDRLRLLWQRGRRTAPPRQQTVHALIAWSYDRLPEHERVILRRLSVLVGTFSFDAAKAVVFEGSDSVESLPAAMTELVAKSLLSVSVEDGAVVYRLLETTRVYALEQLAESGELERASLRHASFFAERLWNAAEGTGPAPFRRRASDLGNVRAALQWCFSSPKGHTAGPPLAAAAARMLLDLGLVSECNHWCRQALGVIWEHDAGTLVELRLQEAVAVATMFTRGNGEDVRLALTRALTIARTLGDPGYEVRLLGQLNTLLIRLGDFKGAMEVSVAAAGVAQSAGTVSAEWMLGTTHHLCGNQAHAQAHCEAALRLADTPDDARAMSIGYNPSLITLLALARTLWLRGHADGALMLARQAIQTTASLNEPVFNALNLVYGEPVFIWCGEWAEADRLLHMLAEHVERYSLGPHRGITMALRGELLVKTGRPEEGCSLLQQATSTLEAERQRALATVFAGALALGLVATGSLDEAQGTIERAIAEARRRGGTFDLPELLHIKGVILASRSPNDLRAVDETLSASIELARSQAALAWELRATTTLARERLRRGGGTDSLRELAAVYARFTEGMGTPDLQAARRLLEGSAA
jgi:predicted ATPase/DNA-binding winged helix-turn-helix (wHTH) protein